MKVFVFLRGLDSQLKQETLKSLRDQLLPGSFLYVNLDSCDPNNKKNAHRLSKEMIRDALQWDTPYCFIIDNPSLNAPDWDSYLALGTLETVSIGIDVYDSNAYSNLQIRNVREFIVSLYKYYCVKLSNDIPGVIRETLGVVNRGKPDVHGT